jgi:protein-S-isoprenylcysteine O-methyltransferase Ste14
MAKSGGRELVLALILSILLTITLFYSTFEVPRVLDKALQQYFPEVFWDVEAREEMLGALRPIGYAAFAATIVLIALGFVVKKGFLSFMGSLAIYLPTFGYFAFAMFFLTGLGALRALWLPMLELSPDVLKLGCIAYLPFEAVRRFAPLAGMALALALGMALVFAGAFVFALGATTWLYGKFRGYEIVDFWIYRCSRHPQYLGFILWSYGLLIFVSCECYVKGAFATPPALPWLVSTMIVVGAAMIEEVKMLKRYGERYEGYRRKAPFTVPMPKSLAKAIAAPLRVTRGYPEDAKSVVAVLALYTVILIIISYAFLLTLRL